MKLTLKEYLSHEWDPAEFILSKWHRVTNPHGEVGPDVDRPVPRGRDFAIHRPHRVNRHRFDLTNITKDILCFCSFSLSTARIHRRKVYNDIREKDFITFGEIFEQWTARKPPAANANFLKSLKRSKFCISPQGNGVDCLRHWDCLYEKCVPIVPPSKIMHRYKSLPILFIEDYSLLTEDFLNNKYKEMLETEYDFSQLKQSYWQTQYSTKQLEDWGLRIE